MQPISRRTFFALGATVIVAACSSDDTGAASTSPPDTSPPETSPPETSPPETSQPPATTVPPSTSGAPVEVLPDEIDSDPFTMGVNSGDPALGSVVLWTRLRPEGEALDRDWEVTWELSDDPAFAAVVDSGTTLAEARYGHSVHQVVEVDGVSWYRFRVGEWTSPVGRCLPAPPTGVASMKIASASCQHYETGFYAAYRDMAEWEPDLIVHLGDFIYEGGGSVEVDPGRVRTHGTPEIMDLADYRARYELYLSDPDLQAARATCPWAVVWDDHEVENNYASLIPQDESDVAIFPSRRDDAYQAWWEHMPVRLAPPQAGEDFPIHRTLAWGGLAEVVLLDGRQYRDDQECGDVTLSFDPPCEGVFEPERSMLGAEQEAWFAEQMQAASTPWKVVAQQTVMSRIVAPNGAILNYDQWDGYPFARQRLYDAVTQAEAGPIVVITGDIHLAGVGRLVGDDGRVLGTEWVTTSISSNASVPDDIDELASLFPDVLAFEVRHRGYTRHVVTPEAWEAEYRTVDDVTDPESAVSTWQVFRLPVGSTEVEIAEP